MNGKWMFYEQDDGCWCYEAYNTREEAIEAAKEHLCDDQPIMYIGQCQTVPLPTYIDVDVVFEKLDEQYGEECFECGDFLFNDVKIKDYQWLEKRLAEVITEFYRKAGIESQQFIMTNVEEIEWER